MMSARDGRTAASMHSIRREAYAPSGRCQDCTWPAGIRAAGQPAAMRQRVIRHAAATGHTAEYEYAVRFTYAGAPSLPGQDASR